MKKNVRPFRSTFLFLLLWCLALPLFARIDPVLFDNDDPAQTDQIAKVTGDLIICNKEIEPGLEIDDVIICTPADNKNPSKSTIDESTKGDKFDYYILIDRDFEAQKQDGLEPAMYNKQGKDSTETTDEPENKENWRITETYRFKKVISHHSSV